MTSGPTRLRRSCLAVPGSSDKMLAKAAGLPADMVFIDLEDAVAPQERTDETRDAVVRALREQDWTAPTRAVRVNGVATRWCHRDIVRLVEGAGAEIDCIVLPKVEGPAHVHFADHLLSQLESELGLERPIALELQIESARGLLAVEEIAAASTRAETLIFGPADFAASLGMPPLPIGSIDSAYPGDRWHYALMRIVTVARAHDLQAIDGPFAAIRDLEGLRAAALRSRALGFDGKWVLHPTQIGVCNDAYLPGLEEFERAERLLEAYATATEVDSVGAVDFNGEMIDAASRRLAEQAVAKARAAGLGPR